MNNLRLGFGLIGLAVALWVVAMCNLHNPLVELIPGGVVAVWIGGWLIGDR